jgi:hypothetical protein
MNLKECCQETLDLIAVAKGEVDKVEHSYPTAKKADSKARVLEAFRRRHGDERHIYLAQISREGKTVRMWRDC